MSTTHLKTAFTLSWIIIILAIITTLGGLLLPNLYQDTEFYKTAWYGNDIVTLLFVVPVFIISLRWTIRGSLRAHLVWLGAILYMLYNYAFYLFGAAFNAFFLLYVALFTFSIYTLFLGLYHTDVNKISAQFREQTPVRWISIFLLFLALPLIIVEGGQSINYIITGKLPETPSLIFALDLSLVVPNMILAAVLLWQRRAWGYLLAAMMLVKGLTYGMVLVGNTAWIAARGLVEKMDPLMPFYAFVLGGSLVFLIILLQNLQQNIKVTTV